MLQQRWEAKIRQKESSPQPGLELTTTRSWVRHWATRAGPDVELTIWFIDWLLELNAILTAKVISWRSVTRLFNSWLSHTSTDTTVLSSDTDYFIQMHHKWEAKNRQRESFGTDEKQERCASVSYRCRYNWSIVESGIKRHLNNGISEL